MCFEAVFFFVNLQIFIYGFHLSIFLFVNLQIFIYGFHLSISCTPSVIQTMTNMTNWCQSNDLVGSTHLPGYFDKLMRVGGEGGLGMVWMEGGGGGDYRRLQSVSPSIVHTTDTSCTHFKLTAIYPKCK